MQQTGILFSNFPNSQIIWPAVYPSTHFQNQSACLFLPSQVLSVGYCYRS